MESTVNDPDATVDEEVNAIVESVVDDPDATTDEEVGDDEEAYA